MEHENKGYFINLGGIPVDLNAGMIEAVTNPPSEFVSKHRFVETNVGTRIRGIDWFARCGWPVSLDLTFPIRQVSGWAEAVESCTSPDWEDVELEVSNPLTLWLHLHDRDCYQRWNEVVRAHQQTVIDPLVVGKIIPLLGTIVPEPSPLIQGFRWDILGALMENSYLRSGHSAFFFLELLMVYEAGHFPCSWRGNWPHGELLVY